jgi:very-short-patch-repair endonuclease
MLYNQKTKQLEDALGEVISPRAVATVRRYQREAMRQTAGEIAFCKLISPVVAKCRGLRYVKQRIIYITNGLSFRLDFLFPKFKLAVEIDGSTHASADAKAKDAWRDRVIEESLSIRTIRFTNFDVTHRYLWVRREVVDHLLASPTGFKRELVKHGAALWAHPDLKRQEELTSPAGEESPVAAGVSDLGRDTNSRGSDPRGTPANPGDDPVVRSGQAPLRPGPSLVSQS